MGHQYFWVLTSFEEQIATLLDPHIQESETPRWNCPECKEGHLHQECDWCDGTGKTASNPNGKFQWYTVGGSFSGVLTGYDATNHNENYIECHCAQEFIPKRRQPCNDCGGVGRVLKPYCAYAAKTGDIQPLQWILDHWNTIYPAKMPYGFVSAETGWHEPELSRDEASGFDEDYYKQNMTQ